VAGVGAPSTTLRPRVRQSSPSANLLRRLFLTYARADVDRVSRIDSTAAFLDVLYLALLVHHEGGSAGKLSLIVEDPVILRHLPLHIAQQRKFHADLFRECRVGGRSVDADSKYRGVVEVDLA
jgi:hypothetical protein